jgi:hypothetical protein
MTDQEFLSLNPEPILFTTETGNINAARTEANNLGAFIKSGTWPLPGSYDVDLLAGTSISYP